MDAGDGVLDCYNNGVGLGFEVRLEAEELVIRKIVEAEAERNKRPTREHNGGWGDHPCQSLLQP